MCTHTHTQDPSGINSILLCLCRYLEPGGDPLHAGLRPAALPGGQRQRDADDDHGLQIHSACTRLPCMHRVSNPHRWARSSAAYFMFTDVWRKERFCCCSSSSAVSCSGGERRSAALSGSNAPFKIGPLFLSLWGFGFARKQREAQSMFPGSSQRKTRITVLSNICCGGSSLIVCLKYVLIIFLLWLFNYTKYLLPIMVHLITLPRVGGRKHWKDK